MRIQRPDLAAASSVQRPLSFDSSEHGASKAIEHLARACSKVEHKNVKQTWYPGIPAMTKVGLNLVGKRVKHARGAADPPITQQELSEKLTKLGVSIDRAGIAKIETGIRGVLDFEIVALADVLDVKVTWLLGVKE